MNWIFSNLGLVVFIFVTISVVRAAIKAAQLSGEHRAGDNETDEQRRVREIQERIRRKIAERRGGVAPLAPSPAPAVEPVLRPPVLSAPRVPPLDPFGGPMRRLVTQLERRVQQLQPPPTEMQMSAVLERQKKLAEEMRVLEETRVLAQRRATEITATEKRAAESEGGMRTTARRELLADLRDAPNLRRAFVLREVLGAPVALR